MLIRIRTYFVVSISVGRFLQISATQGQLITLNYHLAEKMLFIKYILQLATRSRLRPLKPQNYLINTLNYVRVLIYL